MNKDRGMKKWAPYKSLDSQADFLMKMAYEKGKKPKPQLMEDEMQRIDDILASYHGQNIEVSYYDDGYIHKLKGTISKISKASFVTDSQITCSIDGEYGGICSEVNVEVLKEALTIKIPGKE